MRYAALSILLISMVIAFNAQGQITEEEGTVSYTSSQNVYVQFKSTENIQPGDTLFFSKEGILLPVLVVTNKSSISCVCTRISDVELKVTDKIYSKPVTMKPMQGTELPKETAVKPSEVPSDTSTTPPTTGKKKTQNISGRASISSYLNFSNTPGGNSQRFRYTFSMNAKNIANTNLTGECYVSFVQRSGHWDEIKNDVFNGLKIYNLSLRYDFNETTRLWLGRKINPNMSSVGAIDGLQFEKKVKSISFGAFAGSRPDYHNYSFNFDLFQAGAFVGHEYANKNGNMQSTLSFVDQENGWNTDRRFLYFQHYNSLLKNLYFFGSIEFDLFQSINGQKSNTFDLTNFYILLRYKVIKQLTLSFSYSARNNLIYYETYKNNVENLLNNSVLQGVSLQAQYRPINKLSISVKGGYRDRKEDPKPSWNGDAYITYSQVPILKVSATASVTFMQTSYINGKIFSIGLSRDLLPGKVYCSVGYKYVDYKFYSNETSVGQSMAEINLNWNIYKKLLLSVNYEGTFESSRNQYTRLFLNLTQRF